MRDTTDRPAWIDLSSTDPAGSRAFYGNLFGWEIDVNPDPQYGGYALARINGGDAAGIGPAQTPGMPTVWNLYNGTPDAEALAAKVQAAGGTVVAPAFDVGGQGRIAVFRDPSGAYINAWQPAAMTGFSATGPNTFGWAELATRDMAKATPFYRAVFGWTPQESDMGGGQTYTEFQLDGQSIAGGMSMSAMVPPEVPSYWAVYFNVQDIGLAFARAQSLGGREIVAPRDFPGGRFAVLMDPQGGSFGLLQMRAA
jgi:predicted enzyme related to lactoylglutathione lyase